MNSPGKNIGVSSHFLLQGIFLTQGLNLGLTHCRQILYQLSHQGRLRSGIKPTSLTLEMWSLNHWTTREVPGIPTLEIIWKISCVHPWGTQHFLLQHLEKVEVFVVQSFLTLQPHGLQPTKLLGRWDSPGKNTGVGCHFPLQGIFPTQGLNPHLLYLLHCR